MNPRPPLLPQSFCARDALDVARDLVGKTLWHDEVGLAITEVEAYRGPWDSACHTKVGRTRRTATMFGPAGHAYIYLCYGIHRMLNVVTEAPAAVLIRAARPVAGLPTIQGRRGKQRGPAMLTGPGKVGAALGLDGSRDGTALFTAGGLELRDGKAPSALLSGPRVGIDYAQPEHRDAPWRFAEAGTLWVSVRKPLSATE